MSFFSLLRHIFKDILDGKGELNKVSGYNPSCGGACMCYSLSFLPAHEECETCFGELNALLYLVESLFIVLLLSGCAEVT